jgi:hypothetical protein
MKSDKEPPAEFGPAYDIDSATLKKHRRAARGGLAGMSRGEIVEYANAVEAAVLAKQKSQLRRHGEVMPAPHCASGTWHTTGAAIHKAMQQKQRAALLACPAQIRRERTPKQWADMYAEAMADKRKREAESMRVAA